jgi:HD-GYP domain-containing protein (c-di-GMP phosphodiesterase class II)
VCDAWCAMTADRPYQDALTAAAASAELQRHAGTQFDPRVVAAFALAQSKTPASADGAIIGR